MTFDVSTLRSDLSLLYLDALSVCLDAVDLWRLRADGVLQPLSLNATRQWTSACKRLLVAIKRAMEASLWPFLGISMDTDPCQAASQHWSFNRLSVWSLEQTHPLGQSCSKSTNLMRTCHNPSTCFCPWQSCQKSSNKRYNRRLGYNFPFGSRCSAVAEV